MYNFLLKKKCIIVGVNVGDEILWEDPRDGKINVDELFGFFDELLHRMLAGEDLNVGWIFLLGSRHSGKTRWALEFLIKALLSMKEQFVSYVVRKKENQLKRMKKQIFDRLKNEYNFLVKQGVDFKGEPDNTLSFNNNQMIFQTLNDEKIRIDDGGQVGGTTWEQAKYLVAFFEEVSQLKRPLFDNLVDTIRGSENSQKLVICASNPWDPIHWYNQLFDDYLPADKQILMTKGYQFGIFPYVDGTKALFIRNNVLTNKYVTDAQIRKLQAYKKYNENAYNICYLGLAGVLSNTLYASNMKRMLDIDYSFVKNSKIGRLQGAVDWGEGKSRFASPTTMHIARVDTLLGAQVFDELTHWNNGDGNNRVAIGLSQTEQFDKIINFYLGIWKEYQEPITIYVDMGSSIDFNDMINERAQQFWGLHPSQIYFLPAIKEMHIEDRVLTVNMMISLGLYRIDKHKCPMLYKALMNCKQIEPDNAREEQKFEREATWTHWINSGAEYICGDYLVDWSRGWSEIYQER